MQNVDVPTHWAVAHPLKLAGNVRGGEGVESLCNTWVLLSTPWSCLIQRNYHKQGGGVARKKGKVWSTHRKEPILWGLERFQPKSKRLRGEYLSTNRRETRNLIGEMRLGRRYGRWVVLGVWQQGSLTSRYFVLGTLQASEYGGRYWKGKAFLSVCLQSKMNWAPMGWCSGGTTKKGGEYTSSWVLSTTVRWWGAAGPTKYGCSFIKSFNGEGAIGFRLLSARGCKI